MTSTRAPGRPRDEAIDEAILAAAWAELNRIGYSGLTMTAVAAAARIRKPALYRRWPTKPLLVIDTLAKHLPGLTDIDRGSLGADLRHILTQLAETWGAPVVGWSVSPLLAELSSEDAALVAFRERVLQPRGRALRAALDRALGRGEIRRDAPLGVVADLLEGPLMHRAMLGTGGVDDELLDTVLAACLGLLGAPAAAANAAGERN